MRSITAGIAVGTMLVLVLTGCADKAKSGGTANKPAITATGPKTTVKIMVGGLNKQIYLPAMLTQQLGYYAEQGLDVQLSDEPAGVDAENAMLAGHVYGVVGFYVHDIYLLSMG